MSELRFVRFKDDRIEKMSEPGFIRLKDVRMDILQSYNPVNPGLDKYNPKNHSSDKMLVMRVVKKDI